MLAVTPYRTHIFNEAAALPDEGRVAFLQKLPENPFYRPETSDEAFADTAVFCIAVARDTTCGFAEKLSVPCSLLHEWMRSMHIPSSFSLRRTQVSHMIDTALLARGEDTAAVGTFFAF